MSIVIGWLLDTSPGYNNAAVARKKRLDRQRVLTSACLTEGGPDQTVSFEFETTKAQTSRKPRPLDWEKNSVWSEKILKFTTTLIDRLYFTWFWGGRKTGVHGENPRSQVEIDWNSAHIQHFVIEVEGVIDVHYASLTSQEYNTGKFSRWSPIQISRYQRRPIGLHFGKRTVTSVSLWR